MRPPNRLFALALISSMAASYASQARSEPIPDLSQAIIGAWAEPGGSCESDTVEFFNPEGTYQNFGGIGKWSVKGNKLTIIVEYLTDFEEEGRKLDKPETWTLVILHIDPNARIERWPNKSVHRREKCD